MERFCDKCGSFVNGNVKFCPVCGAPMKSAVDLGKAEQPPQSVQSSYETRHNYGYGAPQYRQNTTPSGMQTQTMTTGQWLGTILLCTCLGTFSIILNVIWGFNSATPEPKRSFCRAMLIVNIIWSVLGGIMISVLYNIYGNNFFKIFELF